MDHFNIQKACTTSSVDSVNRFVRHDRLWRATRRNSRRNSLNQTFKLSINNLQHVKSNFDSKIDFTCFSSSKRIHCDDQTLMLLLASNKCQSQKFNSKPQQTHGIKASTCGLRVIILMLILLLQVLFCSIHVINAEKEKRSLPICTRYQACSAEVGQRPLLSETVGDIVDIKTTNEEPEGSGLYESSGFNDRFVELPTEEIQFPLYDEFVSEPTLFDYNSDAEWTLTQLCQCPQELNENDESQSEKGCTFDDSANENIMHVDKSLRLAFCQPISQLSKCVNRRALLRVIGNVDVKTSDSLTSVNDTAVFCRCDTPMELKRIAIEPWLDKYAFVYRCMWP